MGSVSAPVSTTATGAVAPVGTYHRPRSMDLRKITTPILLHLLKDEVRFPWLFLL